jgi:uncharacterized protein
VKIVVDTNCLIASISPKSPFFFLYQAFRSQQFDWAVSTEILLEYEEQIALYYNQNTADRVLQILLASKNTLLAEPSFRWNLIKDDADDNKFSDLALSVNADYLVSNDRHFNVFKEIDFPPLSVIKLDQFKKILGYV